MIVVNPTELARIFYLGTCPRLSSGPVARGKQGHVWRLEASDGSWAVKVPLQQSTEDEVRLATELQEAAYAAGVPTPAVRRTVEGDVLATVGDVQVRVYEWVNLLPPDPLDPVEVGAAVGAIHALDRIDDGPLHPWYSEPVGADRWDELVARLRAEGAPFAERLAALRNEFVALESWIEPPERVQVCHRDLWADNVLGTRDGGICVIDWENSGPADPSQELACVLFAFARDDRGRARALVEAYRNAGGTGRVERPAHFSMLIAELGHVTELAARDWLLPNARCPERADAEAWIAQGLDDPHTRDRLLTLLNFVR